MATWPSIPKDAIEYFRTAFAEANRAVTERLVNVPNIRETSLDDGFIEALVPFSPPKLLRSKAVVAMDIHNIGGLRRMYRWEVADIGVIVFIYRGKKLLAKKIGMLQSKRLYPENNDVLDDDPEGFRYGMNAFLRHEPNSPLSVLNREYVFSKTCVYGALVGEDQQISVIDRVNNKLGESVYYMLYNPSTIPVKIHYPVQARKKVSKVSVGSRVFLPDEIHAVLKAVGKGHKPTFAQVVAGAPKSNWRVEDWIADLILTCKAGQPFDESIDETITLLVERRGGPIGAAIAISVALPGE